MKKKPAPDHQRVPGLLAPVEDTSVAGSFGWFTAPPTVYTRLVENPTAPMPDTWPRPSSGMLQQPPDGLPDTCPFPFYPTKYSHGRALYWHVAPFVDLGTLGAGRRGAVTILAGTWLCRRGRYATQRGFRSGPLPDRLTYDLRGALYGSTRPNKEGATCPHCIRALARLLQRWPEVYPDVAAYYQHRMAVVDGRGLVRLPYVQPLDYRAFFDQLLLPTGPELPNPYDRPEPVRPGTVGFAGIPTPTATL